MNIVKNWTKISTTGGETVSIPAWGSGPFLENGDNNEIIHGVMSDGEPIVAKFSNGRWRLNTPSVLAQAEAAANPMPPGSVSTEWLSSNSFLTLKGTDVEVGMVDARAYSFALFDSGLPPQVSWGRFRIGAFRLNEDEAPFTEIQVALCNGGDSYTPTMDGNDVVWTSVTNIIAPPPPSNNIPGAGPICDWLNISSTNYARGICVRTKRAAGNWSYYNGGPGENYPTGMEVPAEQDGNPDLKSNSGWGTSFGVFPAIYIEFDQLSHPIVRAEVFGDSQAQGYVNAGSGGKGPFGHCHDIWTESGSHPFIVTTNLAKSGQGTALISERLRNLTSVFGSKLILRQTQSTNDDNGTTDVTSEVVAASRTTFDSDAVWLETHNIGLIPFSGPGKAGWASGAYSRFRSFYTLNNWSTTYPDTLDVVDGIVVDPNLNGAPYEAYTDDGSHFNPTGQRAWAEALAPAVVTLLENKGYDI